MFGGARKLANLLGLSTQAVYAWPDELGKRQINHIVMALIKEGRTNEAEKIAKSS